MSSLGPVLFAAQRNDDAVKLKALLVNLVSSVDMLISMLHEMNKIKDKPSIK